MIWAGLLAACLVLAAMIPDAGGRFAALACAAGLLLMRIWAMALLPEFLWLASAVTWIAVGAAILKVVPISAGLLVASGLCYFWARLGGYPFGAQHAPAIMADAFGIAALIWIGWQYRGGIFAMVGNGYLGSGFGRGL